jgi:exopolysaccharide biosynthesis predicted pyruvyltransferase EpsI
MRSQTPLHRLFVELSGRRFVFVRPGGNWGDYLIYKGAEALAKKVGLTWRTTCFKDFTPDSVADDEVVYIHGGGALCAMWNGPPVQCLERALDSAASVVIMGPCTVESYRYVKTAVSRLTASQNKKKLYFYTREKQSFAICRAQFPPIVDLVLNEDTAFYLTATDLIERCGRSPMRQTNLFAIREDKESINAGRQQRFYETVLDPVPYASSLEQWIRIHAAARSIVTNRAHSAICGAILGVRTTMFSGAYHKNRSIWEFSLQRRGVSWLDDIDDLPRRTEVDPLLAWFPTDTLRRSWKLNRAVMRLRGVPLS